MRDGGVLNNPVVDEPQIASLHLETECVDRTMYKPCTRNGWCVLTDGVVVAAECQIANFPHGLGEGLPPRVLNCIVAHIQNQPIGIAPGEMHGEGSGRFVGQSVVHQSNLPIGNGSPTESRHQTADVPESPSGTAPDMQHQLSEPMDEPRCAREVTEGVRPAASVEIQPHGAEAGLGTNWTFLFIKYFSMEIGREISATLENLPNPERRRRNRFQSRTTHSTTVSRGPCACVGWPACNARWVMSFGIASVHATMSSLCTWPTSNSMRSRVVWLCDGHGGNRCASRHTTVRGFRSKRRTVSRRSRSDDTAHPISRATSVA